MERRFEDKVAFVTGAARGQGRAECVRLAEEGADIIAVDICAPIPTVNYDGSTPEDLAETERLVKAVGRQVVTRVVDTRDLGALQNAVDDGVQMLGRLDVVVANAGICTYGLLWELTEEQFRTMIDVNVVGTWNTLKSVVPTMIAQDQGGCIIVTSSVGGKRGMPWLGHYVASKHAVTGMAKTLANEVGRYGIRVVSLHPNAVNTHMGTDTTLHGAVGANPHLGSMFVSALPTPMYEPEIVAAAVAYIASDEARFMTGNEFVIDLGNLCR